MRSIRRTPLVVAAAGALALTACAGDQADTPDDTESVTQTETTSGTTSPSPSDTSGTPDDTPSPTGTSAPTSAEGGVPHLSTRCELPADDAPEVESVTFAVPDGWQVEDGNCEFFDPTQDELPEDTEAGTALGVRVTDTPYAEANTFEELRVDGRWAGARSGYQAVRVLGESTGQGLRPEGEPVLLYLVDLDAGTDESGGTLVMSAGPSNGASFELAAEALDRIAQSIIVDQPAVEEPVVITRHEGGGQPFTVTWTADAECVQLRPGGPDGEVADEACELEPNDDGIAAATLESGDQQVVAGIAPPLSTLVESDAASAPYGAIVQPIEGGSLFAYDVTQTPVDVRADDAAGEVIAEATVE